MKPERKRIAVVGDLVIDRDHEVAAESREREGRDNLVVTGTVSRLGAAGGVALMVSALGCDVVLACAAAAEDAVYVRRSVPGPCICLQATSLTATRERFWRDDKPVGPRIDKGAPAVLGEADQLRLAIQILAGAPDAIIVCDHSLGMVGPHLMRVLRESRIPIFADPHVGSDWSNFYGIECLCMNRHEALAAVAAQDPLEPNQTIQHCDRDGLWWYRAGWWLSQGAAPGESDPHRLWYPSACRGLVDSLGAGDQFIAALACCRAEGLEWEKSILWANAAAGLQCERRGVVPVAKHELLKRMSGVA